MRRASELYGSHIQELAFIIGCGESIKKAKRWLMEPHPHSFRIALNAAIRDIPAEYWFTIDGDAYEEHKDHPNAKAATRVACEVFKDIYDEDTYVWERAMKLPDDVVQGKLLHRGTSFIAAIGFAAHLGAFRIVSVGNDNRLDPEYLKAKQEKDPKTNWKNIYAYTFSRINLALREMPFWLPAHVSVRDASDGDLPLAETTINQEFEMLDRWWARHENEVTDGRIVRT